jgi:hypothetical protein
MAEGLVTAIAGRAVGRLGDVVGGPVGLAEPPGACGGAETRGGFGRLSLALPRSVRTWTLTTLREKRIKIGAKVSATPRPSRSSWLRWRCRGRGSRRSWLGSVGCERRVAPGDGSLWADGGGVESRRTGMVRPEAKATGRETSRRGPSGRPIGHPAGRQLRSRRFFLDMGTRPESPACSAGPGVVPDNEVNPHPGNPD